MITKNAKGGFHTRPVIKEIYSFIFVEGFIKARGPPKKSEQKLNKIEGRGS